MDNEYTNLEINVVICGMTSVGKSTFLNALCKRQYAETGIKPTTMKPHLYSSTLQSDTLGEVKTSTIGSTRKSDTLGEIKTSMKDDIVEINLDSGKNDLLICHQIDPLSDLIDNPNIILNIIDLPGLSYKNIDWLIENIKSFNVIIFMTDIGRGLRDREEVDHIEKIISKISG